jgi:hypothetical protein
MPNFLTRRQIRRDEVRNTSGSLPQATNDRFAAVIA